MKGSVIALDHYKGRMAAVHVVDGQLDDVLIEPPQDVMLPGAICRAICDRPLKGQGGMMLRLPDGRSGYLRQGKGLTPGTRLLVQVTGFAEDGKAVPVTQKLLFKSRYAIVTPGAPGLNVSRAIRDDDARVRLLEIAQDVMGDAPEGLIIRSAAETGEDADVASDITQMLELSRAVLADSEGDAELLMDGPDPHLLAWREWPTPDHLDDREGAFDRHNVHEMIDALRSPHVSLSAGASMFVEPTRAFVAVDVNTGGGCRGLGGQIVVDFAPCPKKDRRQLEQVLRAALRADGIETSMVGWTQLGLYELQRKRERLPLARCLKGA